MPEPEPRVKINDRSPRRPLVHALRRRRSLQAGLVQLLYVCVAIAAGLVVPTLDVGAQIHSSDAISLIAGVSAGLLALTGIVFALLFLVVQFSATSQSPRLNLFRDSPLVWHTLGLIVGVLVYAATTATVAASTDFTTVLVPVSVLVLVLVAIAVTRRLTSSGMTRSCSRSAIPSKPPTPQTFCGAWKSVSTGTSLRTPYWASGC